MGKSPHNVYRSPDGLHMIATSMDDRKLTFIKMKTAEPEFSIHVGGVRTPIAIGSRPDGSIPRLFVQFSNLHGFEVVDYATRNAIDKVRLRDAPAGARPLIAETFSHGMGIAPDRKSRWVNSLLDNSVSALSLPDLKRGPNWMTFTPGGKPATSRTQVPIPVSAIDTTTRKELARIPVGKVPKRIINAD